VAIKAINASEAIMVLIAGRESRFIFLALREPRDSWIKASRTAV
jgi:hypothetical protein